MPDGRRSCVPSCLRNCFRRLAHLVSGRFREPAPVPQPPSVSAPGAAGSGGPAPAPLPSPDGASLRRRLSFGGPIVSADTGHVLEPRPSEELQFPRPVLLPPPPAYDRVSTAELLNRLAVDEQLWAPPKPDKGKGRGPTPSPEREPPRYQTRSRTRGCPSPACAL